MRLTVLAGAGSSTEILLNWLAAAGYDDVEAIIEEAVPRKTILRNRLRRLGLAPVVGQVAFMAMILPWLSWASRGRRDEILRHNGLSASSSAPGHRVGVENINSDWVADRLCDRKPDVVLVNGTRILRPPVLGSVNVPFINTHVGITPTYRGVHGGYWALWNRDAGNFGVTLHLVDAGVDTGAILAQVRTTLTKGDNFASYPLLQQAAVFPALARVLDAIMRGERPETQPAPAGMESRQWYHPTLFQYVSGRLRGVK